MTWPEVRDLPSPILVVPVGAVEQHGPHLPLATDTLIANALARGLCTARPDVVLAPSISVTASGEHQGFPGTMSIGTDATAATLIELVRSVDWCAGVVLVNCHGGNTDALARAIRTIEGDGRDVLVWWPRVEGGDLHAGATETSLMLSIAPELVRLSDAVDGPIPSTAALRRDGVASLSPTGVLGSATKATVADGDRLVTELVDDLVASFDRWLHRRSPHGDGAID